MVMTNRRRTARRVVTVGRSLLASGLLLILSTAVAVASEGTVEHRASTASYQLTLVIGPTEQMLTPEQAKAQHATSGEVMVPMPGMPMTMGMGNRHVELHVATAATGAVVKDAMVTISLTNADLVVHPASLGDMRQQGDAEATGPVATTAAPDEGVAMGMPVGGGRRDGLADFLPGLEAPPLEGEGTERFPPRFDQIQGGGVGRLEDERPARMRQREQQDIGGAVGAQMVHDGEDARGIARQPGVDSLQKVASACRVRRIVDLGLDISSQIGRARHRD